eukprot:47075-Pelagomonas_calceolata.AAC.3
MQRSVDKLGIAIEAAEQEMEAALRRTTEVCVCWGAGGGELQSCVAFPVLEMQERLLLASKAKPKRLCVMISGWMLIQPSICQEVHKSQLRQKEMELSELQRQLVAKVWIVAEHACLGGKGVDGYWACMHPPLHTTQSHACQSHGLLTSTSKPGSLDHHCHLSSCQQEVRGHCRFSKPNDRSLLEETLTFSTLVPRKLEHVWYPAV